MRCRIRARHTLGVRTLRKMIVELRVSTSARRNRTDAVRWLVRRPLLVGAIGSCETALLLSSKAQTRLRLLAPLKAASLGGCPF
jgi:hypothetical protein